MKLIVGLGNPEKKYDGTRHNVGFALLDRYAAVQDVEWQPKEKFKALVAELPTAEKVLLVKPTTYYNLVGESVRALADFYKIAPEHILVIHDDHVLPFGTLRTREQGSDAGNNGIKSINAHLGPTTRRLRVGTHSELRDMMNDADYVLSKFSAAEKKELKQLDTAVADIIDDFIANRFVVTTRRSAE
jgi:PTH1 family peptidyl-tRNA hydrolase